MNIGEIYRDATAPPSEKPTEEQEQKQHQAAQDKLIEQESKERWLQQKKTQDLIAHIKAKISEYHIAACALALNLEDREASIKLIQLTTIKEVLDYVENIS